MRRKQRTPDGHTIRAKSVCLTESEWATLEAMAITENVSLAAMVRTLILRALEARS
jgi:predicted DNA-binding ribbon-helix-helix protein